MSEPAVVDSGSPSPVVPEAPAMTVEYAVQCATDGYVSGMDSGRTILEASRG